MLYAYNKDRLTYYDVTRSVISLALMGSVILTAIISIIILIHANDVRFMSEETKAIIINESSKERQFSPAKLKAYILDLNLKFPHVVYAQAKLESGNFKSGIFRENNNLFGMKEATKRPTTTKGTENGHAFYESWQESVVDYGFYQAQYLSDIKTEGQYLEYLKANYAEAPTYMEQLQRIIKEEKK